MICPKTPPYWKYLFLANRISLETLHIPTVKHSVLSIVPSGFSSYLCAQFRTGHEDAHARQSASKLALLSLNRIIAPNYNIIKR